MGKFLAGIPLNIMSPVMRDAVVVCQKLKVRFLWIDSLCIMQDSKKDWEMQSSKMCEIYTKLEDPHFGPPATPRLKPNLSIELQVQP